MSLRERPVRNLRPRWPAQFDIEGIPRDSETRERCKQELLQQELTDTEESKPMAQNEFDRNNPPRVPYVHQDYPRLLYKGAQQFLVADAAAEKEAHSKGFTRTPDAKKVLAARAKENKKALRSPAPPADDQQDSDSTDAA